MFVTTSSFSRYVRRQLERDDRQLKLQLDEIHRWNYPRKWTPPNFVDTDNIRGEAYNDYTRCASRWGHLWEVIKVKWTKWRDATEIKLWTTLVLTSQPFNKDRRHNFRQALL